MPDATAVVIGLCAHGLAICRSLHGAGIHVVAIEANRSLPGVKTNSADIIFVENINDQRLVTELISLAPTVSKNGVPVLFVTNDTMINTIGTHFEDLKNLYRISWATSRHTVLPLLRKEHISRRCQDIDLRHPRSLMIRTRQDASKSQLSLIYPVLFKPDKPVSGYKTLVVENEAQLNQAWATIASSLPSIAQEFIPGDDSNIYFAALYLRHGKILARFEGRKLRSRPMGHTTIAISDSNDNVHTLATRFFDGLDLSGPVSLEVKKDPKGDFWIIEPTVGRTDFWVDLCVRDGINLPLIEYHSQSQHQPDIGQQGNRTLWINGERDPAALAWLLLKYPRYLYQKKISGVFVSLRDYRPHLRWAVTWLKSLPERALRKLLKVLPLLPLDNSKQ